MYAVPRSRDNSSDLHRRLWKGDKAGKKSAMLREFGEVEWEHRAIGLVLSEQCSMVSSEVENTTTVVILHQLPT